MRFQRFPLSCAHPRAPAATDCMKGDREMPADEGEGGRREARSGRRHRGRERDIKRLSFACRSVSISCKKRQLTRLPFCAKQRTRRSTLCLPALRLVHRKALMLRKEVSFSLSFSSFAAAVALRFQSGKALPRTTTAREAGSECSCKIWQATSVETEFYRRRVP